MMSKDDIVPFQIAEILSDHEYICIFLSGVAELSSVASLGRHLRGVSEWMLSACNTAEGWPLAIPELTIPKG